MFRRLMICLLTVAALATACGSGDRDLVVDLVLENNSNEEQGIVVLRPCLESKVDEFSAPDLDLIAGAIKTGVAFDVNDLSPAGLAHSEALWADCIDLDNYRSYVVDRAIAKDANVAADCLRAELLASDNFSDIRDSQITATHFCGGTG